METMTFSRYNSLMKRWKEGPSAEYLLTWIAAAGYGYKLPPPTPSEEGCSVAMAGADLNDLLRLFPSGKVGIG